MKAKCLIYLSNNYRMMSKWNKAIVVLFRVHTSGNCLTVLNSSCFMKVLDSKSTFVFTFSDNSLISTFLYYHKPCRLVVTLSFYIFSSFLLFCFLNMFTAKSKKTIRRSDFDVCNYEILLTQKY